MRCIDARQREAALVTFMVTASGLIAFFGRVRHFWGLVAGMVTQVVLNGAALTIWPARRGPETPVFAPGTHSSHDERARAAAVESGPPPRGIAARTARARNRMAVRGEPPVQ